MKFNTNYKTVPPTELTTDKDIIVLCDTAGNELNYAKPVPESVVLTKDEFKKLVCDVWVAAESWKDYDSVVCSTPHLAQRLKPAPDFDTFIQSILK